MTPPPTHLTLTWRYFRIYTIKQFCCGMLVGAGLMLGLINIGRLLGWWFS